MRTSRERKAGALLACLLAVLVLGCLKDARDPKYGDDPRPDDAPYRQPADTHSDDVVQSNAEQTLFNNSNDGVVRNGPAKSVEFTVDVPTRITYVQTYHWNDGAGVAPGRIGLKSRNGTPVGMWDAVGTPGQGGVANAYWEVEPDVVVEPGTYVVVDSDPASQATNDQMGGAGQTVIRGVPE